MGGGNRIETSRLQLGEERDIRASEFFTTSDSDERHKREAAREWLISQHEGDWQLTADVKEAAEAKGHRPLTVQRAFGEMVQGGEATGAGARSPPRGEKAAVSMVREPR